MKIVGDSMDSELLERMVEALEGAAEHLNLGQYVQSPGKCRVCGDPTHTACLTICKRCANKAVQTALAQYYERGLKVCPFCGTAAKLFPYSYYWVVECCNDSCRANCTALASKDAVDSWNSKDCIRRGRWYNREKGVSLHGA